MFNFSYYTPTKVVFGKGTEASAAELVKEYGGSHVLLHYGGQSAVKSGLIDRVKNSLEASGLFVVSLGGVVPNPHLSKVREGIELGEENKVDFILAVGGGSVIDSAKAIAYGLADKEHDVWDFYHRIGMPTNMRELGIEPTQEQIVQMAESCAKAVGGSQGSAKLMHKDDMIEVYKMAL